MLQKNKKKKQGSNTSKLKAAKDKIPGIWKKRKKLIIGFGILILVAAGGGIWFFKGVSAENMPQEANTIQSVTAETGSITTTVVGSGNIAAADAEDITIPSDIKVEEVMVESGDTVAEGDVLASLDANSILSKMASVQTNIESIDADLNALDTDEEKSLTTYISGRVKKIYVSAGSDVTNVMGEYGALLILSTDGKMAVDFESTAALSVDDEVDVILSDGSTTDGTISKISGNSVTVTMSDYGPDLGEAVTVNDTSGNALGTGELYINQPVSITGSGGTVDSVDVSEEEKVDAEETLMTLSGVSASSEYLELTTTRKSLVETLQDLSTLSQDNTIKATFAGTVESVNLTEGGTTGSSSSSDSSNSSGDSTDDSSASAANMSTKSGISNTTSAAAGFVRLNTSDTSETDAADDSTEDDTENTTDENAISARTLSSNQKITSLEGLSLGSPFEKLITDISEINFTGTATWTYAEQKASENTTTTTYTADVTISPNTDYEFTSSLANAATIRVLLGADSVKKTAFNKNGTITFTATFIETIETETQDDETTNDTAEETDQNNSGTDGSFGTTDNSNQSSSSGATGSSDSASASSGTGATESTSSDTTASDSSSTADSASSVSEPSDDVTAFSISPSDSMQVSITVDELDILSIKSGQEATITLDAVEGEFTGEVSKISDTATTSGGVVSYDVDIAVPKDESMKTGMSASATITIAKSENIVTLPVDAVQEMGDRIFVYTKMDEETNELSGEVEIETGLSDGSKVEITSGLSEGDTIYYMVAIESESSDSESTEESGGMMMEVGGGQMGGSEMGGGSAPEGGMRPSGNE